jgi:hypothetical protein
MCKGWAFFVTHSVGTSTIVTALFLQTKSLIDFLLVHAFLLGPSRLTDGYDFLRTSKTENLRPFSFPTSPPEMEWRIEGVAAREWRWRWRSGCRKGASGDDAAKLMTDASDVRGIFMVASDELLSCEDTVSESTVAQKVPAMEQNLDFSWAALSPPICCMYMYALQVAIPSLTCHPGQGLRPQNIFLNSKMSSATCSTTNLKRLLPSGVGVDDPTYSI